MFCGLLRCILSSLLSFPCHELYRLRPQLRTVATEALHRVFSLNIAQFDLMGISSSSRKIKSCPKRFLLVHIFPQKWTSDYFWKTALLTLFQIAGAAAVASLKITANVLEAVRVYLLSDAHLYQFSLLNEQ